MTTKPTNTKTRGCGSKVRHVTRKKALAHLWRLVRRGAFLPWLNVYRCRHCGSWHVGHRPGRRSR